MYIGINLKYLCEYVTNVFFFIDIVRKIVQLIVLNISRSSV